MWSAEADIPKEVRPRPDIDDWQLRNKKGNEEQISDIGEQIPDIKEQILDMYRGTSTRLMRIHCSPLYILITR